MRQHASETRNDLKNTWKSTTYRWQRNAVVALTTGALVMGGAFAPVALSGVALASPFSAEGVATASTADSDGDADNANAAGDADNTNSGESDADNTGSNTGNTSNEGDASNTNANTNANTNSGSKNSNKNTNTSGSTTTNQPTDGSADPDLATPNLTFGAPTTSVVIEGSVNGEIMAEIALAEPDGTPEGGQKNKYNYGSGQPWCAYFVMYCARAAGLSTDVIPNYAGCPMLVNYYKGLNRWQPYTNEYHPHVGDLIFFSESLGGIASHVGIVTASTEDTVTTREGNTNMGQVATHVYNTTSEDGLIGNDFYILGYASPDYPEQVAHEHVNNVASVLDVSDTSHLVTYAKCECGYEKPADLVAHNFKGTGASVKLSESDEWVCIDCGAKQTHYTTGIRTSATTVTVYGEGETEGKQLPAGSSLTVTSVSLGTDGNYWGTTAEGYRVKMSNAGVKQTSQFAPLDMTEDERSTAAAQSGSAAAKTLVEGRHFVAKLDWAELGDADTTAKGSGEDKTVDATYKRVTSLDAGKMYFVTIDAVRSSASGAVETKNLGSPMLKLMDVAEDGTVDVNDMRIYGASGQKISFSDERQGYIIVPEKDTTLVIACQGGKQATANDVVYDGINVYRID